MRQFRIIKKGKGTLALTAENLEEVGHTLPEIPAPKTKTSELENDGADGLNPFITEQDIPAIPAEKTKTSELENDGADGENPFITAQDIPTNNPLVTIEPRDTEYLEVAASDHGLTVIANSTTTNQIVRITADSGGQAVGDTPIGTSIRVIHDNSFGTVTIVGVGEVTFKYPVDKALRINARNEAITLLKTGINTWTVLGDLAPAV